MTQKMYNSDPFPAMNVKILEMVPIFETTKNEVLRTAANDRKYVPKQYPLVHKPPGKNKIDLMNMFEDTNYFGIVGDAGSGKSVCLKRYTTELQIKLKNSKDSRITSFGLFLYHDFASMDWKKDKELSLMEVIFSSIVEGSITEVQKGDLFNYFVDRSNKLTLIFDGYDQLKYPITEDTPIPENEHEKGTLAMLLKGVLSKKFLPKSKIVLTSRYYALADMPSCCLPHKFGRTDYLPPDVADAVLKKATNKPVYEFLKKNSVMLQSLAMYPIMFDNVVHCYMYWEDEPPTTISIVMLEVLFDFVMNNHYVRPDAEDHFNVALDLAFDMINRGQRVCGPEELVSHGLDRYEHLRDYIFMTTRYGKTCASENQYSIKGSSTGQSFSSDAFLEAMAAVKLLLMPVKEFKKHLPKLSTAKWVNVQRFLYGFAFYEKTTTFLVPFEDIKNKDAKHLQMVYRATLVDQPNCSKGKKKLEYVVGVKDSNQDYRQTGWMVHVVNLDKQKEELKKALMEKISDGVLCNTEMLLVKEVYDKEYLNDIHTIDLSYNFLDHLDHTAFKFCLDNCKNLAMIKCKINQEEYLDMLMEQILKKKTKKKFELEGLDVSGSPNIIGKKFASLASHVKVLGMSRCKIGQAKLKEFVENLHYHCEFTSIDLRDNKLTSQHLPALNSLMFRIHGFLYLGDITKKHCVSVIKDELMTLDERHKSCQVVLRR